MIMFSFFNQLIFNNSDVFNCSFYSTAPKIFLVLLNDRLKANKKQKVCSDVKKDEYLDYLSYNYIYNFNFILLINSLCIQIHVKTISICILD